METLFTEKDSIPFIKRWLQSIAHLTFLVASVPFGVLLFRHFSGMPESTKLLLMVSIATVVILTALAVFYIFLAGPMAVNLSHRKGWYARFLNSEKARYTNLLAYYNRQGKRCVEMLHVCEVLLTINGDRDARRRSLVVTTRKYINQLQTEVMRLPASEQKKAEIRLEKETDRMLDKLLDLEDQPIDPENAEYLLELNESLSLAEKRVAEYKKLYLETKEKISELDKLMSELKEEKVHA